MTADVYAHGQTGDVGGIGFHIYGKRRHAAAQPRRADAQLVYAFQQLLLQLTHIGYGAALLGGAGERLFGKDGGRPP